MSVSRLEKYVASMILAGAGDAIGYKNGSFEFCNSGQQIHKEVEELGGLANLSIKPPGWIVSDDTVMHLATGEALVETHMSGKEHILEYLLTQVARKYVSCMDDMTGRGPGLTCQASVVLLKPSIHEGYRIPYSKRGGGCGAAMRSACIGLRYPNDDQLDDLIAVSVESGRMTHHHPTGYLGGLAAAFFTSCAIQSHPVVSWGKRLMDLLPKVKDYIVSSNVAVQENLDDWWHFEQKLSNYLDEREISSGEGQAQFPQQYGVTERDTYYTTLSHRGTGGASGDDSIIIAYDALLGSKNNWLELCNRAMLHGGDSDSTGTIAAAWYGALNGLASVPPAHYEELEYLVRMKNIGEKLYKIVNKECTCKVCS